MAQSVGHTNSQEKQRPRETITFSKVSVAAREKKNPLETYLESSAWLIMSFLQVSSAVSLYAMQKLHINK